MEQIKSGKEKLEQKTIDFEKLEDAGLKDGRWDVVFITYVFGFQMQLFISLNVLPDLEPPKRLLDQQQLSKKLIGSEC